MTVDFPPGPENAPTSPPKYLSPRVIIGSGVVFVGISIVALLIVPQLLLDHYLQNLDVDEASVRLALGNTTQVVLFSLGGFIALVGVVLSLSRHRLELETSQHDRLKEDRRVSELMQQRRIDSERELRARFTQAVALLSDPEKPTTRQSGVYALGALADDWHNHGRQDEQQVCIDVICGYLRSKWTLEADDAADERRIRVAAFELIGAHLRTGAERPSWDGANFNLSGAIIDFDLDLSKITIASSNITFQNAKFSGGELYFGEARLSGGVLDFSGATFSGGVVDFDGATLSDGTVDFDGATFSAGKVKILDATLSGSEVSFTNAIISGGSIDFAGTTLSGGEVNFVATTLSDGEINFRDTKLLDGEVNFTGATLSGGTLSFNDAILAGGGVDFFGAALSGGTVSFVGAALYKGEIDFSGVAFSGNRVHLSEAEFMGGTVKVNGQIFRYHPVAMP